MLVVSAVFIGLSSFALLAAIAIAVKARQPDANDAIKEAAGVTEPKKEWILESFLGFSSAQTPLTQQPFSSDIIWLDASASWRRKLRRQANLQRVALVGVILFYTALPFLALQGYQRNGGDWAPMLGFVVAFLLMLPFIKEELRKSGGARQTCALGVFKQGIVVRERDGTEKTYQQEQIAFDGDKLYTPDHAIKLVRWASLNEQTKYHCSKMPLFDRDAFIRYLLPLLIQPSVLKRQTPQGQWTASRGLFLLGMLIVMFIHKSAS